MSEIEATVSETPMRDYQSALIALQEQLAKDNNDVAALEKMYRLKLLPGVPQNTGSILNAHPCAHVWGGVIRN